MARRRASRRRAASARTLTRCISGTRLPPGGPGCTQWSAGSRRGWAETGAGGSPQGGTRSRRR